MWPTAENLQFVNASTQTKPLTHLKAVFKCINISMPVAFDAFKYD